MEGQKNVLSKLAEARLSIKANPIKKDGTNSFSNYQYFTPELVAKLVTDACKETNTICLFSLLKDKNGYYGEVVFTDLESGEYLATQMRTERPSIKATNETQQMGGMLTYTKRYALMSLFDIEDNSIDFDSQDNRSHAPTKNTQQGAQQSHSEDEKPWLNTNHEDYQKVLNRFKAGNGDIKKVRQFYRVSKQVQQALEAVVPKNVSPQA